MRRSLHLGVFALAALAARPVAVWAHPGTEPTPDDPPLPMFKGADAVVHEQLGARVPLDAFFRNIDDGRTVRLGDVIEGGLPVVLTFNYSNCPMLCSLQLNGLTAALPQIDQVLQAGKQFRIVTIDLEPNEPLDRVRAMKERYIQRLPERDREAARAGWTFLVAETIGDEGQIRRVAKSVGFGYVYVPERAEWAHPAALIFLSSAGAVTRYVYGIEFDPAMMRESIYKAGVAEPLAAVGFMNRCYHYDPDQFSHAAAGMFALKLGAAVFAVLFLSTLALLHFVRKARRVPSPWGEVRS